ncbi:MAG: polysaccharide deacetylase family protein [Planctomycetes bacterium]|nr:polysaccharide deacetylase family protein [Planctomycetota bacterium]
MLRLPAETAPRLLVVLDTEEEFDWSKPFDRANTGVEHMRSIERFQSVFDAAGVRPVYVIDHPIATQRTSSEPLRAFAREGRCEVGAHLHPWVSPPFDEDVNARNSYPGNLPRALEREKLLRLTDSIETHLGVRPRCYKAGRYGFGPNTAAILAELGYSVDLSPCPPFDFGADGGPDYRAFPVDPFWLDRERALLSIPTTGAFTGWASGAGNGLYALATAPALRFARLPGILSRLGALERLHLSPEGYRPEHHAKLVRALLQRGARVFTFALHSPSVLPGCTPYVRTEADLEAFLDSLRRFFELFLSELGGVNRTASELHAELLHLTKTKPA